MTSTDLPRRTRQREVIETYLGSVDEFQSAQQVYDGLRTAGTPVSLPTVYRTLASMAEGGDLDILSIDGMASYRQCSPHHHHHLTCRSCGRTIELMEGPVEEWAARVAKQYGFTQISHISEVRGTCPKCQAEES
ncbi:MAG: transcriptional repressor [Propionibacteriaceae bacterium]|nr:transcriptional repressor [Propionibacteriaceae bacterium]